MQDFFNFFNMMQFMDYLFPMQNYRTEKSNSAQMGI